jgi:hypothetical protein
VRGRKESGKMRRRIGGESRGEVREERGLERVGR